MIAGLSQVLFAGMVCQLTSMPEDTRVERDIYQELPEHRGFQRPYLEEVVVQSERNVLPMVYRSMPSQLCDACISMNVVFAEQAADLHRISLGQPYKDVRCKQLVIDLHDDLQRIDSPGYAGDRELTDRWATRLGMRDWYLWCPLHEKQ